MPEQNEIERLAAMGNQLRPEWPVKSLRTFLTTNCAGRTYRDLAVALAWIACDPKTQTPKRLLEAGPWWAATSTERATDFSRYRMTCPEHPQEKAGHCAECIAQKAPKPADFFIPKPSKHLKTWTPEEA